MGSHLNHYGRRAGRAAAVVALAAAAVLAAAQPAAAQPAAARSAASRSPSIVIIPRPDQHAALTWGLNANGQLGDRTLTTRLSAVKAYGLASSVTQVAGGNAHSLALRSDGSVWAWGDNSYGQLGLGTTAPWPAPQHVPGLTGVIAIAAGGDHSMALTSDGKVWAWGSNYQGMLGDGTTVNRTYPVAVGGLTGVTAIAAGGTFSLALRSDGSVWSWGAGDRGQLGDGTWYSRAYAAPASQVGGPVTQISAGYRHALALLANGTVRAWGDNSSGQLGDGYAEPASARGVNPGLTNVAQIAAGWKHSLIACDLDGAYPCGYGEMFAWGDNSNGELGDGTMVVRTRPVLVQYRWDGVTQVAAGFNYSAALASDYGDISVVTWGLNNAGQLGDGTTTQRLYPVEAYGMAGANYIAAGDWHMLAIKWIDMTVCCG